MGSKVCICDAISTPDVNVKLETSLKQLQKFLNRFPSIKPFININDFQEIFQKHNPAKFAQGIYIGPVNANILPHTLPNEKGIFLYELGFLYFGQMLNGKRQALGKMINQDGEYYDGSWVANTPDGAGFYFSTQTERSYKGNWLEGLQEGSGLQKYQDGSSYVGHFVKGLKHGKGRLLYPDGTYYQGQFKENIIFGQGICVGKFHKYEGEWLNGKMHGTGISTWTDENGNILGSYIGQYKEGLKHGYGEYKWEQKKIYKGKWQQGDMSSEGVLLNYES